MVEKRTIRALVPYSKTFYFLDGADQRGLTYEMLKQFEKFLNKQINTKVLDIKVIIVPTERDRLLPALAEGLGDIAAGNLTITPERLKTVDFSMPYISNIDEIIVSGPLAPSIQTIDDLSGKKIHVRQSSSYYESLSGLNEAFERAGKVPMELVMADEKKIIDRFMRAHKKGTQIGNILFKRYLENTKWVRNALNEREFQRFKEAVDYFNLYADRYDFDWLLIAALAYQESRIDQNKRSREGAIGVMQLLPSTAADPNVGIPKIEKLESNIHAGTKYLRFIYSRYFEKEPMSKKNKMLFTFASYNAGPAKIRKLRSEAKKVGLDPNIWFRNVEIVAARRIGRETVQYVSNIYKYYTAYRLIVDKLDLKREVRKEAAS